MKTTNLQRIRGGLTPKMINKNHIRLEQTSNKIKAIKKQYNISRRCGDKTAIQVLIQKITGTHIPLRYTENGKHYNNDIGKLLKLVNITSTAGICAISDKTG